MPRARCKNGTRKNKKTGRCEVYKHNNTNPVAQPLAASSCRRSMGNSGNGSSRRLEEKNKMTDPIISNKNLLTFDYFTSGKHRSIEKIENEPYAYWVGSVKLYVFDESDLKQFLEWFWQTNRSAFVFNLFSNGSDMKVYKYFRSKITNFKNMYPTYHEYLVLIQSDHFVESMREFIESSGGFDQFVNVLLLENPNRIGIRKRKNLRCLYAGEGQAIRRY
jgi:hypothetical protein